MPSEKNLMYPFVSENPFFFFACPQKGQVICLDFAGRPLWFFSGGNLYKRGLDNRILEVAWGQAIHHTQPADSLSPQALRRVRDLPPGERADLLAKLHEILKHLNEESDSGRVFRWEGSREAPSRRAQGRNSTSGAPGAGVSGSGRLERQPLGQSPRTQKRRRREGRREGQSSRSEGAGQWGSLRAEDRRMLSRAVEFAPDKLSKEAGTFAGIYSSIGILPPDQSLSVVFQVTDGCRWGRCTFCRFYEGAGFHVKSPEEFARHAREVAAFLGEGIFSRRSAFLGTASAFSAPHHVLVKNIRVLYEVLDGIGYRPEALYSFCDGDLLGRKERDIAELASLGLKRVYIGLETGDDEIRKCIKKPVGVEKVIDAARIIKAGGVDVSLILMAGIGGKKFSRRHVEKSVGVVRNVGLGPGDIVYLSPVRHYKTPEDLSPSSMSFSEKQEELGKLEGSLRGAFGKRGPMIAPYDILEFVY